MRNVNNINEGVSQEEFASLLDGDLLVKSKKESLFDKIKQKLRQSKEKRIKKEYIDSLGLFDNDGR